MTSQYFDNPGSATNKYQYHGQMNNAAVEFGRFAFTTTGATVEVPTYLSTIKAAILTPFSTSSLDATFNETLYCDLTITSMCVTVSRVSGNAYKEFHFPLDEGQISSYNYVKVPLLIAQAAMTLTNFEFYHGTAYGGGTTICNLGKSTDDGYYLEDISVTNAADTTAAGVSTSTFTSGTSAVADGDVLIFETEGGTTSGPGDGVVSMSATVTAPTLTSALAFNYIFIGFR